MKELLILQKNRRVIPTQRPKTRNHYDAYGNNSVPLRARTHVIYR